MKRKSRLDTAAEAKHVARAVLADLRAEKVNHPAHYGKADDPYEVIKVIDAWGLGFSLGTVVKYLGRCGKKAGESRLDDLRKAAWYLQHAIEQETKR